MAVFVDTFENKVDRKGRVSVPASFRAQLASSSYAGIIARPSRKFNAIEACDLEFMQNLKNSVTQNEAYYSEAHDDLSFSIFTRASMVPFDGEGRIILPAKLLAHAGISDRAAFAGFGSTFLIFEPEMLERTTAEAERRAQENGLTVQLRASEDGRT